MKKSVCAVIVTYNCSPDLARNVALLLPQVETLLIVDNGSRPDSQKVLQDVQKDYACTVIYNGANLGVAAALNIAVDHATRNGFEWLATFDQDSQVSDNFVRLLLDTFAQDLSNQSVGMILPRYIDRVSGVENRKIGSSSGALVVGITSGAITKVSVFESCGLFEESLFIDCVDTEFCLRISRERWRVIQSERAVLVHSLGRMKIWACRFGCTFSTTNHSAARRYYIARNRVFVWRRYLWNFPRWTIDDMGRMVRELLSILILETGKSRKLAFTLLGFRDGLLGRLGYRIPV